jgi:hypothetical protein
MRILIFIFLFQNIIFAQQKTTCDIFPATKKEKSPFWNGLNSIFEAQTGIFHKNEPQKVSFADVVGSIGVAQVIKKHVLISTMLNFQLSNKNDGDASRMVPGLHLRGDYFFHSALKGFAIGADLRTLPEQFGDILPSAILSFTRADQKRYNYYFLSIGQNNKTSVATIGGRFGFRVLSK